MRLYLRSEQIADAIQHRDQPKRLRVIAKLLAEMPDQHISGAVVRAPVTTVPMIQQGISTPCPTRPSRQGIGQIELAKGQRNTVPSWGKQEDQRPTREISAHPFRVVVLRFTGAAKQVVCTDQQLPALNGFTTTSCIQLRPDDGIEILVVATDEVDPKLWVLTNFPDQTESILSRANPRPTE